jgi:phosphotransferase system enzyme I (PtsI)
MSGPLRLTGTPASGGYAEGPVFRLDGDAANYAAKGSAAAEADALKAAIEAASGELAALAAASTGDAADMLEFQLAMLADDSLSGPAFEAIGAGAPADQAWSDAMAGQIAGYEAADDEYFRARAADLKDIRQQVLDALTSAGGRAAPPGAILFGEDIAPTRFLATDWSAGGGIALSKGSSASHVAMLARSRGVPMVVGLGHAVTDIAGLALLDAEHGGIVLRPTDADLDGFRKSSIAYGERRRRAEGGVMKPAATENGVPVRVLVNVADPADVERIDIASCDGVARRGDAVPRLPQSARMGRRQAGDHQDHRRRRRQAGA